MKLHRITASALAPLSLVASLAAQLPNAPLIVAGAGVAALGLHGSASAQTNKRVCGILYTKGSHKVGYVVEVPKSAANLTCAAFKAVMDARGIKKPVDRLGGNLGYTGWSKSDFGPATCEDFTKSKLGRSGDICLSMAERSIYTFGDGRLTP